MAAGVAAWVNRGRRAGPPTQPRRQIPAQLDRADFVAPPKRVQDAQVQRPDAHRARLNPYRQRYPGCHKLLKLFCFSHQVRAKTLCSANGRYLKPLLVFEYFSV